MAELLNRFYLLGIVLAVLSPLVAIAAAVFLFARHRNRVPRERGMPAIAYVLVIVGAGGVGGLTGLVFGVVGACHVRNAGNLCGLWGVFITGPLCAALGILLVALAVASIRPAPGPGTH